MIEIRDVNGLSVTASDGFGEKNYQGGSWARGEEAAVSPLSPG